jgi:hypothetical protein
VPGVKATALEAEVRLPSNEVMGDADIARAANSILQWTIALKGGRSKASGPQGLESYAGRVVRMP